MNTRKKPESKKNQPSENAPQKFIEDRVHDHSADELHAQHRRVVLAIIALICFEVVSYSVRHETLLYFINEPILRLTEVIRYNELLTPMTAITWLGKSGVMGMAVILFTVFLILSRNIAAAAVLLTTSVALKPIGHVLKDFYAHPRPGLISYDIMSFSYPSGHTLGATTLFFLCAAMFAHGLEKKQRPVPYIFAFFIASMVAFSRVYLGAHWFLDVLGGFFLGLSIATVGAIVYNHFATRVIHRELFSIGLVIAIAIPFAANIPKSFKQEAEGYVNVRTTDDVWGPEAENLQIQRRPSALTNPALDPHQ